LGRSVTWTDRGWTYRQGTTTWHSDSLKKVQLTLSQVKKKKGDEVADDEDDDDAVRTSESPNDINTVY
jgi:hypothetical protein